MWRDILFIEPEIVEEEGVIYRLEKCGAIENYHMIFSIPNFLRRETEGKAIMKINLLLPGEYSRKINKESRTLNRKH